MKTNNDSILSILLPSIGILIFSILGFLLVVSCNVKPTDKDSQQKTEEKPIERISNLESGYCVISDSNDLTQTQLKHRPIVVTYVPSELSFILCP